MGKQVADRNVVFAVLSELRDVFHHRVVQSEFALLFQLHYGGGRGHNLGERGDVEDGFHCHRRASGFERAAAEGFAIDHLALMADQKDRAGDFVVLNRGLDDGIEHGEGLGLSLLGEGRRCPENDWQERPENPSMRVGTVSGNEMNLHQRQWRQSSYGGRGAVRATAGGAGPIYLYSDTAILRPRCSVHGAVVADAP